MLRRVSGHGNIPRTMARHPKDGIEVEPAVDVFPQKVHYTES
jgi:hypothetical protein